MFNILRNVCGSYGPGMEIQPKKHFKIVHSVIMKSMLENVTYYSLYVNLFDLFKSSFTDNLPFGFLIKSIFGLYSIRPNQ